jgi:hypothetical protein
MELLGIEGSGMMVFDEPGTEVAEVEKVTMPVFDTLYWLKEFPLKTKVKGRVCTAVHVGAALCGSIMFQLEGSPLSYGSSRSLFKLPGLPGGFINGGI